MIDKKEALLKIIYNAQQLLNQMFHIVFFKNTDFTYAGCNPNLLKFSRLNQIQCVVNLTDYDMPWAEDTDFYRKVDKAVLLGEEKKILMQVKVSPNEKAAVIQRKTPIKDVVTDTIIGVMAVMSEVENSELNLFLNKINSIDNKNNDQVDLIKPQYCFDWHTQYGLTERESEFLFYLLRGMTTKMIARILNLSPRTVEKYSLNVKQKLGCYHKSELVEKAIKEGFLRLIPPGIDIKKVILSLE